MEMHGGGHLVMDWVKPPWWLWPFARRVRRWYNGGYGTGRPFVMGMDIEWRWQ